MNDKNWARRELQVAAEFNLRFWLAQLHEGKPASGEANNVLAAISAGQRFATTRRQAAKVLEVAFPLALKAGKGERGWLALHSASYPATYSSELGCRLLWQHAVLLWRAGEFDGAQTTFAHCEQRSVKAKLSNLALMAAIGQTLCNLAAGKLTAAQSAARRVKARMQHTRSRMLKPQAWAAVGMVALFEKDHKQALAAFNLALELTSSTHHAIRAQLHLAGGLCQLGLSDPDAALRVYNQAASELRWAGAADGDLARLELMRAAAHYAKRTRGQHVRMQPAIAALQRAAELLRSVEGDEATRRLLESEIGKVYTRAGDVARGIEYLTSALELAEGAGDQRMAADLFASLQELANKNSA